jgi:hypothetical protein
LPAAFLLAVALGSAGCQESSPACELNNDCPAGFVCLAGICWQDTRDGQEPQPEEGPPPGDDGGLLPDDGPEPGDDGGLPPDDGPEPGDDGGGEDAGDSAPAWVIVPGQSVGPLAVSQSLANMTTLAQVRGILGEPGVLLQGATYTMTFLQDRLWAVGIDVNGSKSFDDPDRVISIMAREGLNVRTQGGLTIGSTRAEVRGQLGQPDHFADLAPSGEYPGGRVDEYFRLGLFVGYGTDDVSTAYTVTRVLRAPDGRLDPTNGTLAFGSTTIYLGDGNYTGDSRSRHLGVLGEPDWHSTFDRTVSGYPVTFYLDSYRIQGLEFIGVDNVMGIAKDKLVVVAVYPFYYGTTAQGLGVGSPKSAFTAQYGQPTPRYDATYQATVFVYTAGTRKLGVLFTHDGQAEADTAVMLVLNYQET